MVPTIQDRNVTRYDRETKFKIEWVEDDQFFREWQDDLPEISEAEKQRVDRVKASYRKAIALFWGRSLRDAVVLRLNKKSTMN
ncbi:hypothetical protein QUA71_06605 [Microcoleus sp. MON1_C5]|uniref:hypothetical protein n=1 Tax=Microcoleus sp. MON1_C5 TaxID=2818828 RepID=UPI002FD20753